MGQREFLCDNEDVSGGIYGNLVDQHLVDQHSLLSEREDNNSVGSVPAKEL